MLRDGEETDCCGDVAKSGSEVEGAGKGMIIGQDIGRRKDRAEKGCEEQQDKM
jgi:hypothetical protein